MSRVTLYKNLYSKGRKTVFPESAQHAIHQLRAAICHSGDIPATLEAYRDHLARLPAAAIPQATREIRVLAGLDAYAPLYQQYTIAERVERLFGGAHPPRTHAQHALGQYSDLAWLYIFHGNGYYREAALKYIRGTPQSPFEFAALVYRLNDWVPEVRQSALHYATRQFPHTRADVVSDSALFVIPYTEGFTHWTPDAQALLQATLFRPEVLSHLSQTLMAARSGRVSHTLQYLLQCPAFDTYLPLLSKSAALPCVRARCTATLLRSRAQWRRRSVTAGKTDSTEANTTHVETEDRALTIDVNFEETLAYAAKDKAAQIRKVAADALISQRHQATQAMDNIALTLASDARASVRSRIDFYLRKRNVLANTAAHEP